MALPMNFHTPAFTRMPWLAVAALAVSVLALLPLGFVLWVAVQSGWETVLALVFRPRVAELLINTVWLVGVTVPLATVLALALAWLTERSDLPGARTWAWLAAAPLAVPAFVHSYAWISVMPGLHGLGGAVLVSVRCRSTTNPRAPPDLRGPRRSHVDQEMLEVIHTLLEGWCSQIVGHHRARWGDQPGKQRSKQHSHSVDQPRWPTVDRACWTNP